MIRRLRRSGLAVLLAAFAATVTACGPAGRGAETTPTLPGDEPGDRPASKPTSAPTPEPEDDPWAGRTDLIEAPPAAKPAPVNLPTIQRFTLPNGLRVLVVENHELPVASFHLAVGVGIADEPRDKRALADFAAAMLTKGTKSRTADEIAETIDYVGGGLGASADYENTHVTCETLSKDVATCLELLPDVVTAPTFPEREMGVVRDQLVSSVKQMRDDPQALAEAHFENVLWGEDHVRGWPLTVETVSAITQKDLVAWHGTYFKPNNAILAIAGDVDAKQLRGQLTKAFGGWKKGPAPKRRTYAEPKLAGRLVRLVDKPDQTQSQIIVGHLGVAHADPDYFPTILMNYTLGGGAFSSRLMKVVRSQGGKTYGASSAFERWKSRGVFQAQTFTRNSETLSTLGLVLGEIKRMREGGPTAEELADAQANLAGSYPLNFQNAGRVASSVLSAELHGLGEAYVREYPLRVAAVTLEEVKAAAARRLDWENVVIVVVGRAEEVAPQLRGAGLEFEVVGYLEPISKRDRDARKQALSGPVDPKKAAEGKKLLDAALAAKGGAEKVKAIRDVVTRGAYSVSMGGQTVTGKYARLFIAPDKLREDIEAPGQGTLSVFLTADAGWAEFGGQKKDLPADAAEALRGAFFHHPELILVRHTEPGVVVQALPRETVNGVAYDVVQLRSPDSTYTAKLLLDPQTKLIFRIVYDLAGQEAIDEFGDYKPIGGVQVAHRYRTENPFLGVVLDVTYTDVKINSSPKFP